MGQGTIPQSPAHSPQALGPPGCRTPRFPQRRKPGVRWVPRPPVTCSGLHPGISMVPDPCASDSVPERLEAATDLSADEVAQQGGRSGFDFPYLSPKISTQGDASLGHSGFLETRRMQLCSPAGTLGLAGLHLTGGSKEEVLCPPCPHVPAARPAASVLHHGRSTACVAWDLLGELAVDMCKEVLGKMGQAGDYIILWPLDHVERSLDEIMQIGFLKSALSHSASVPLPPTWSETRVQGTPVLPAPCWDERAAARDPSARQTAECHRAQRCGCDHLHPILSPSRSCGASLRCLFIYL
ncbi:Hypothetical predicted protein [Marmota monax]|uniref:Uncharacterized protein n=1 Tax=Marmota monax TaxID=9995 RepID=A0A5E4D237_MARMO|nr:Hypothetical predicted protein [Marmota monax]